MKRRDLYRELLVSSFFSIIFLYVFPFPPKFCFLNDGKETINIGVILKGVGTGNKKSMNLLRQFVTLYQSILKHTKEERLNFIFMTGNIFGTESI